MVSMLVDGASSASGVAAWPLGAWVRRSCAVVVLLAVVWVLGYAAHVRDAARTELVRSTQAVATGVAGAINRALGYGFALDKLVQVQPWLRANRAGSPLVRGMAVWRADGQALFTDGELPPASQLQLRLSGEELVFHANGLLVTAPLRAGPGEPVQGYLAVASEVLTPSPGLVAQAFAALAALLALAIWLWRRYLSLRVQAPLVQTQRLIAGLTTLSREAPAWPARPARQPHWHAASELASAWRRGLRALQARHRAVLTKASEVRASHFDPGVVKRIDDVLAGLPMPPAVAAAPDAEKLTFAARLLRGLSLRNSLSLAAVTTLLSIALCLGGIAWWAHQHYSAAMSEQKQLLVQAQWQSQLQQETAVLQARAQEISTASALEAWISGHRAAPAQAVAQAGAQAGTQGGTEAALEPAASTSSSGTTALVLSVLSLEGEVLASSQAGSQTYLNRRSWPQGPSNLAITGVWWGEDRKLHAGHAAVAERANGARVWLMASRPLAQVHEPFSSFSGQPLAVADLRGQVAGEDASGLVAQWLQGREQSRRLSKGALGSASSEQFLLAWPLLGVDGRRVATMLSVRDVEADVLRAERTALWMALAAVLLLFALALVYVAQVVNLWARGVRAVVDLTSPSTPPSSGADHLRIDTLERATQSANDELSALHAMKRSRERQGKRQARFMRHQMMALAQRLDEGARQGVLEDLARIEAASREVAPKDQIDPAIATPTPTLTPTGTSAVVDEVSVLALGFQSLVGRVGDQYAQLERLVAELRAALQAKTQLIAIQQELEIASKMQLSMLPTEAPDVAGVEVGALMHAAKEVGGDFYDYFRLDEHRLALAVGDVSGKGVPAAFFMAVSRTLLRALAQIQDSPAACLARLNDLLEADNKEMMFVTLFYAVFDTRDGLLTYANGGHNPPYVLRTDGSIEAIESLGNMALAVMGEIPYGEGQVQLRPGDGFFAFTDGVTEATSPVQELFGEERLEPLLRERVGDSLATRMAEVLAALRSFEGPGNQADDITMLALRYESAAAAPL